MGNYTFTKKDYHTEKGYFTEGYVSSPGRVAYKMLIVPLNGFDGPFFYVKELGSGLYEVSGEGYEYQKNWKESMKSCREQIADAVRNLKLKGRLGYLFLDETGQVVRREWAKFHRGRVENEQQWFITDDDCFQCCRIIKPNNAYRPSGNKGHSFDGVYELIQVNRAGPVGTRCADKYVISHGTIYMSDYTEDQVVEYIRLYGYNDLVDFLSSYEEFCCQMVAEMIFETDWLEFTLPGSYPNYAAACKEVSRMTGIDVGNAIADEKIEYEEYKFIDKAYQVLNQPYSEAEIKANADENGYIEGVVKISLADLIEADFENFLDYISVRLINSVCLSDIQYKIVGAGSDDVVLVHVSGQAEIEE